MKIPYNQVHVNGGILFAARSGRIHSFNLADGKFIGSWQHPDVEKVSNAVESNKASAGESLLTETPMEVDTPQDDANEPPAKRQKTATEEDVSSAKPSEAPQGESEQKGKKGKGKNKQQTVVSRVPDRPIVTHLTSTADGRHVLAVTGHDKTIWVLEHDGEGNLKQTSQRSVLP